MFSMKEIEQFALRLETFNVKFKPRCWSVNVLIAVLCKILENLFCHGNVITAVTWEGSCGFVSDHKRKKH